MAGEILKKIISNGLPPLTISITNDLIGVLKFLEDCLNFRFLSEEELTSKHPDFVIILAQHEKRLTVDSVSWILEQVYISPLERPFRLFIFVDFEKISRELASAFLKIFEEPPDFTKFFIITPSLSMIPETIVSRAFVFWFPSKEPEESIELDEILKRLLNKEADFKEVAAWLQHKLRDIPSWNTASAIIEISRLARLCNRIYLKNVSFPILGVLARWRQLWQG